MASGLIRVPLLEAAGLSDCTPRPPHPVAHLALHDKHRSLMEGGDLSIQFPDLSTLLECGIVDVSSMGDGNAKRGRGKGGFGNG